MAGLKCQLSSLMPVPVACDVLGEDRVKRIVSGVVTFQTEQETAGHSLTKEQVEDLNLACEEKTERLFQAMIFVPGTMPAKMKNGGVHQAMMLMKKMDVQYSVDSIDEEDQIPSPIRNAWKSLLSTRSLMLDKLTFLRFLVPSCAQPHTGQGGHMGLFDCLIYALHNKLSSTGSSSQSVSMPLSSTQLITIPDLVVFFAVCQKYWDLQGENDPDMIPSFSGDDPAIVKMSQLMFLVYDGYQKNSVVGRDTIHRFMADVYGDESYKSSPMKDILSQMFTNPNSPLTSREFRDAICQTMSYIPTPSHFLLDWMATLSQAIMPAALTKGEGDDHVDTVAVGIGKNLPDSAAVLLKKMDRQRRWLPELCEKYYLAEYRLFEIKRRFHSLVESTATIIKGDPMSAAVNEDGGNNTNTNSRRMSGTNSNTPKHVIPPNAFFRKVCGPSEDMGHGGYLPREIAEMIFESIAKSSSLLDKSEEFDDEDDESKEDEETNTSYWDLYHVLQFGGMALRSKDKDKSLVKWIMQLFCKRGSKVLNRADLGEFLACLCAHLDFRKAVDRPKWEIADDSDEEKDETNDSTDVMVTESSAVYLGLLPQTRSQETFNDSVKVPVKDLVDYFLQTIESKDDAVTEEQFLNWHKETKNYARHRLGPLIIDIRLVAGVMFGVPPKYASLEFLLVKIIQERHRMRYPHTDVSRRGPRGTVWYLVDNMWYRSWTELVEVVGNTKEDREDLRDKSSNSSGPRRLGQINNTKLLRENGSLALRVGIKWQRDYEILPPLGWSALQAWYDGGPPISRMVVPYNSGTPTSAVPNSRGRQMSLRTENELELYPIFVTMFLCDSVSRGEARPFQQGVPVSRVSPIRMLMIHVCKELDANPDMCRLWVMESSDDEDQNGKKDWLLDVDCSLDDQRKKPD
mmetsp:Transcript_429/g.1102  ORF Transcript_429/g.1102 Transcript_429/m.1102 type:complete len:910 (+) Transcript_429:307-3036(+)